MEFKNAGFYPHPATSKYVRDKLLQGVLKLGIDTTHLSKKVFISRKDAPLRKIINEDEVFELFKPYGFVRYELSNFTVCEQIMLMHNADIVIGEHGAGLTNILFCKSDTLVIELFQKLIDNSNWWIANIAGVNYVPVNCLDEDVSWAADWKKDIKKYWNAWSAKTVVSLDKIDEIIENYITKKD
jgi:capsular polysaccharide biosynthesis protein